ncbi:DUF7793 family protein [Aureispira anguillae]|uniref:DUF7793 domain-containing protein n=1 Tax=Aureispira anguillae TaxID=2864201 RepID=A0A916DSA5_9BACT|nr:hypothetical protein [Aureispira anguillae]BDS11751.1 hypothetical protein AsAng_0024650 [Aureispira anguillae]
MEYHTKELTITVRPDDIIEIATNKNFKGEYSIEAVAENLATFEKAVDGKVRATLLHFPDHYVKKEVMKGYANSEISTAATALFAKSFASKLIGNLFLSLRKRLVQSRTIPPTKVFTDKKNAIEWLLKHIEAHKQQQS